MPTFNLDTVQVYFSYRKKKQMKEEVIMKKEDLK
jgi:hypothetical protein